MKNALIAAGLVLAGVVMVPSVASAMCIGAGNVCHDTMGSYGNVGYQQPYGQQYSTRSYQPQAITFPVHNTTFPSYIPGNQYGYQQYPYHSGYQSPTYYYPQPQYAYNQYNYSYEDYYEEYYGYNYGSQYGSQSWADCRYSQGGAYYCY